MQKSKLTGMNYLKIRLQLSRPYAKLTSDKMHNATTTELEARCRSANDANTTGRIHNRSILLDISEAHHSN